MSSNDHKTFKTDATQKSSTDTEIISDAIILPPYSTDHVLTITAPSSTSNLTGQVDVELEMSPDGENWCALQTEETITTQGGGTSTPGANAEDANLKAVSTVPDSTHTIGQYKNKFALGNLAYDDSGNETAVNQGSKDFMHQFISKDKPFNYSLWYKTDTNAQAFGDDYTPVLFRHGGKDKFTNSNVVQLTDQGAAVGAQNTSYMLRNAIATNNELWLQNGNGGFSSTNSFYGNQGTKQNICGTRDFTTTCWIYLDTSTIAGTQNFITAAMADSLFNYFEIGISVVGGSFKTFSYLITASAFSGKQADNVMSNPNNISFSNGWYLYSVSNDAANKKLHYRIINQSGQLFRELSLTYTSAYDFDASFASGNKLGSSNQYLTIGLTTARSSTIIYDEYGTYNTYLSTSDLQKLTNGTTAVHPLNAGLSPTSYFRFGDVSGDATSGGAVNSGSAVVNCDVGSGCQMATYKTSDFAIFNYDPVTYPHHAFMNYTPTGSKVTQNLCNLVNKGNGYALRISNDATTGVSSQHFELTNSSGTFINPFKLSTESNLDNLPTFILGTNLTEGVTISANIRVTSESGTDFNSKALWRIHLNDSQGNPAGVLQTHISLNDHNLRSVFLDNTGKIIYYGNWGFLGSTLRNGNWHHISQSYSSNTTTASTHPGYYWRVSIDGATPAIGSGNNIIQPDWSTYTISKVQLGGNGEVLFDFDGTPTSDAGDYYANLDMDNVCFYTGYINTNNNWTSIYNARKNPLSFSSPNMVLKSCFTMGDQNDDRANFIFKDIVEPSSGRQFVESSTNAATPAPVVLTLTSADDPYIILTEVNQFSSVFNSTSSFSVSGWFKTVIGDTGTLFSNTGGTASTGLKVEVSGSGVTASYLGISNKVTSVSANNLNDGNWHHIVMVVSPGSQLIVVDNFTAGTSSHTLATSELQGSNGFTLLSDGQNNVAATIPSSTDSSKLNASLSNWSIHSEDLDDYGIAQLYSNGHVRNIKNLPSINPLLIKAWWQLNDSANPEQDSSGNGYDLVLQDGASLALTNYVVGLTDGAPLIVEEDQYGSGITMSLTKRFDVINNEWTNVHTHPTCICLSFNGFEDQAEYFAIYNPDTLDVANNAWHHTSLSFSGKEGSSTNNTVNFCFDSATHNFVLSIDGNNYTTAHFVGGLGGPITNKCFPAEERHLKFVTNDQEDYMPHAQLNSNIFESINQTDKKYEPVVLRDYKTSFIGYADESSFHSESWFTDETGTPTTSFNDQKTATLYGSTSTLSNRGVNSTIFTIGKPYPLRRPSIIGASTSTGNQYIDPNKYNASTNADGGLEAWWRWGDTLGDCSENINDAVGFESDPIDGHRSLKARNYISEEVDTDNDGIPDTPRDLIILTETDSIYVAEGSTSTGGGECTSVAYLPAIIENIQAGICNIKNLTLPVLQYIRIKFTNSGEAQLGKDKVEASIHYRKRR